MTEPSSVDQADYTVAWLCALPLELAAAESILDDPHHHTPNDAQSGYSLGKIAGHNVVIGCLPSGIYGTNAATGVVSRTQSVFPNIRYGLMVGIGGGVPSKAADVRLGDIVDDRLFRSTYTHSGSNDSCTDCNIDEVVTRPARQSKDPQVHYGTIASGNGVMKDARERDEIAERFNVLCFEMEAAGIMNHLPCIVVRGICNYCDSHKNKEWQGYAALVAAIYAKMLLKLVPVTKAQAEMKTDEILMLPFDRNPRFLGRSEAIQRLKSQVLTRDHTKARRAAISGLGGVGKTQVTLELAYTIHSLDPTYSIFWIASTSIETAEQAFQSMCKALGLPDGGPDDIKSRVKAHLSSKRAGSWLLIVDNADDPTMWLEPNINSSHPLKSFLPQSHEGFILFTSRSQRLMTQLVGPGVIRLSALDDASAVDLFKSSLIEKELTVDEETSIALIHYLCGLPLALIQAASFINENSVSL
ncbi:hypothetical protein PENSUB_11813 [Penicillium subrubescens]|uniref:Nucleoside phosphorylase domain-containing protein n=1 Tax=Penicillium subrubescens TaxID=1316194 RepID=A0A1Q5T2V8_9EURO|nr:hypothetical protein PENSUB_11813 [Penicillium subrubescens]